MKTLIEKMSNNDLKRVDRIQCEFIHCGDEGGTLTRTLGYTLSEPVHESKAPSFSNPVHNFSFKKHQGSGPGGGEQSSRETFADELLVTNHLDANPAPSQDNEIR